MSTASPFPWPGQAATATSSGFFSSTSAKRSRGDMNESRKRTRFGHARSTSDVSSRVSNLSSVALGFSSSIAPPISYPMQWTGPTETTASGLPISSDSNSLRDDISVGLDDCSGAPSSSSGRSSCSDTPVPLLLTDAQAAQVVRDHLSMAHRKPNSQHERILRTLVFPRTRAADFELDDAALASIFSSANELFFAGRLQGRVAWDWSHTRSTQYHQNIIGTTAVRKRPAAIGGGLETLIILSQPILRDGGFNRRLLISTFLHEMIHCFLFVSCGMAAIKDGGHTPGFKEIARMIDSWAGQKTLHLCEMEADLERFRDSPAPLVEDRHGSGRGMWYHPAHHARSNHHFSHIQVPEQSVVAFDSFAIADAYTRPQYPVYRYPPSPRHSHPVIDTRLHMDPYTASPATSREHLNSTLTRPVVHEHRHEQHVPPQHPRHQFHPERPFTGPRRVYHPATLDQWDSLAVPPSATPSPSPSPSSSVNFTRRLIVSPRYGGL
ncbi:hypothetical protein TD95_003786 [Thielaviopsis punctulata]|uniref:SprT-like domain-containing protein n=1 Tax=Thielaviopsis punctulata TaxID=72032 RepID=A0A0F4ZH72_9PEZI|nr:hypothetical protein TD95_003786 [Thielaviopsis punctulata]